MSNKLQVDDVLTEALTCLGGDAEDLKLFLLCYYCIVI